MFSLLALTVTPKPVSAGMPLIFLSAFLFLSLVLAAKAVRLVPTTISILRGFELAVVLVLIPFGIGLLQPDLDLLELTKDTVRLIVLAAILWLALEPRFRGPEIRADRSGERLIVIFAGTLFSMACLELMFPDLFIEYYSAKTSVLISEQRLRLSGGFLNPNYLGFAANCTLIMLLATAQVRRGALRRALAVVATTTVILLTGSKTALICLLALIFFLLRRSIFWAALFGLAGISATFLLGALEFSTVSSAMLSAAFQRFSDLVSGSLENNHSLAIRLELWQRVLDCEMANISVGNALANCRYSSGVYDSQYVAWIAKYGIYSLVLVARVAVAFVACFQYNRLWLPFSLVVAASSLTVQLLDSPFTLLALYTCALVISTHTRATDTDMARV